jgi:hypothetical protein
MYRDITPEGVMKALELLGTPATPGEVYLALSGHWIRGRGIVCTPPLIDEGPREALQVYATLLNLVREGHISSKDVYARSVQNYGSGW